MASTDTSGASAIRRVRRVGRELHVTYADGHRLDVPAAVDGPFTSKVAYGFEDGRYVAERVSR